jgi:hypothetical protein
MFGGFFSCSLRHYYGAGCIGERLVLAHYKSDETFRCSLSNDGKSPNNWSVLGGNGNTLQRRRRQN